ncbi:MAG: D-glycero-alpha-D-manno-heptose-1,7-bisphosphate 7-phosphatase [Thermovirgaceae bacterium]
MSLPDSENEAGFTKPKRAVFLDRDGTLIEEKGYIQRPEEVVLLPQAAEALKGFRTLGLKVVILTNQSGIGRGFYTEADYDKTMARLFDLLREKQTAVDASYFCPHAPWERCPCRKPSPGMAERAALELSIDLSRSFVVGDKASDMELARVIGARGILVRTGFGAKTEQSGTPLWDAAADDLAEAAEIIKGWIAGEKNETREGKSLGRDHESLYG